MRQVPATYWGGNVATSGRRRRSRTGDDATAMVLLFEVTTIRTRKGIAMATQEEISEILEPLPNPKSFTQILREGVPHKGGLKQLADAERMAPLQSSIEAPAGPSATKNFPAE